MKNRIGRPGTVTVVDVPNRRIAKVAQGNGIAEPHRSAISQKNGRGQ